MPGSQIPKRKLTNQFPRKTILPSQSSRFWAKEKDRYLRQLLIADLELVTGREVIVHHAQLDKGITHTDADDISEVIDGLSTGDVDLIIQTPGGSVDAVEKLITVLRSRLDSYRVIVPGVAKSGGTVVAISSSEILLGVNSELGPIDPQFLLPEYGSVPCQIIADDDESPQILRKLAESAVTRMGEFAAKLLREGMLKKKPKREQNSAIKKLSDPKSYNSHGAVIDFSEAEEIGLTVSWMPPDEELWKRVWLLHCCYDFDAKLRRYAKITEGAVNSLSRTR